MAIEDALDTIESGLLAIPVFEGGLDGLASLGQPFESVAEQAEIDAFKGKRGQVLVLPPPDGLGAKRLCLVGLGPQKKWKPADLRGAAFAASGAAADRHLGDVALALEHLLDTAPDDVAQFAAEGAVYGSYRFDRYRTNNANDNKKPVEKVALAGPSLPGLADAVRFGQAIAEATCFARDLVNEPPRVCTPSFLVQAARDLAADTGMDLQVLEGVSALEAADMGLFAAVAWGSEQPPALIHLTYRDGDSPSRRIAFVGKGVTYDSGGYSLKPPAAQLGMHGDMAGGAAVLGAARAIGAIRPKDVEVHFVVPASENLVSGKAYKLNDIITAKSGKTVEVTNTDAEGRLLLGDALVYAEALGVDEIVDIATLTGANVIALGAIYAGVYTDDDGLFERFQAAGDRAGEALWRLPMPDRLNKKLKSQVADVKNSGGREGSGIQGALFLKNFVSKTPWIHVDMAGLGTSSDTWEHIPKGATGFGVATLTAFACAT